MIEAMACCTPVIAWKCGSIPELVDDGITGFIVDSEDAAAAALRRIDAIDHRRVRSVFEERFSATAMAKEYVAVYWRQLALSAPADALDETAAAAAQ